MKKLTTGIFTVLLGLVAADANAAITSKAYVDDLVGDAKTEVTNAATSALNEYKTSNDAAVAGLDGRLDTAEGEIDTLQTTVSGLQTGEGSVATQIANALDNYTTTTDMNTKLDTKADNATIGTVTEGKTVVQMINEAQTAATYDDTALAARVTTNEGAIKTINEGAVMTSGITEEGVTQIGANKTAIEAINNAETGILKQAKDYADQSETDAKSYADGLASNYATAAQGTKADNALPAANATVAAGSYNYIAEGPDVKANLQAIDTKVAQAIANVAAGTSLGAGAVTSEKIADNAVTEDKLADAVVTKIDGKQDKSTLNYAMGNEGGTWTAMTEAQQGALNSGVTTGTVAQVATNTTAISNNKTAFDNFKNAIETSSTAENGKYVLTVNAVDGNRTYSWELIERSKKETTPTNL